MSAESACGQFAGGVLVSGFSSAFDPQPTSTTTAIALAIIAESFFVTTDHDTPGARRWARARVGVGASAGVSLYIRIYKYAGGA